MELRTEVAAAGSPPYNPRVSSVEQLASRFVERTLPKDEWTHEAHLRVGLWHLLRYSSPTALSLLRDRIRSYNESIGGTNSDTSGYHETITRFYVWLISSFLETIDTSRPLDTLADELIARYGDRDLPLRYWSRDRLMSVEARAGWVEPDLRLLDGDGPVANHAESRFDTHPAQGDQMAIHKMASSRKFDGQGGSSGGR